MKHMDIVQALSVLRPGAIWSLSGDDLSGLVWMDTSSCPDITEIQNAIQTYVPPPSLQDQLATLQAQVQALLTAQGE